MYVTDTGAGDDNPTYTRTMFTHNTRHTARFPLLVVIDALRIRHLGLRCRSILVSLFLLYGTVCLRL